MSNKKIAVISKNEPLSSLIEAELALLGISVKKFKELEYSDGEFDGYIFDCSDNTPDFAVNSPLIIAITDREPSEEISEEATHILKYPFRLSELRDIFIFASQEKEKQKRNQEPVIFANKDELSIRLNGRKIKLSRYEFTILELLCANAGKYVTRSAILEILGEFNSNIAEVYICHLRKKLEADRDAKIIYTVRQKGYMTNYKMK